MIQWMYIIKGGAGTIVTRDVGFAEQRSKCGYQVFCKRETNMFKGTPS